MTNKEFLLSEFKRMLELPDHRIGVSIDNGNVINISITDGKFVERDDEE